MITFKHIDWREYQHALIPDTAPHIEINLTAEDCKQLFKKSKSQMIRWVSEFDCNTPQTFWYLIKDGEFSLDSLSSSTRKLIRKGIKNCRIEKVDAKFIAEKTYPLFQKAFSRYNTHLTPPTQDEFYKNKIKFQDDPLIDFWVVYSEDGEMIAFNQSRFQNDSLNFSESKFDPDYFKLRPSEFMYYTLNDYYLNEKKVLYVNSGARPISHDTFIESFMIEKFQYRRAFCKLNVTYKPLLKIMINSIYFSRNVLPQKHTGIFSKINVLLKQEEIRRSCLKK